MPENENKNNKILLIGALLIALIFGFTLFKSETKKEDKSKIASDSKKEISNHPSISTQELLDKIVKKEKIQIIDVRSYDEFQVEHIADSVSVYSGSFSNSVFPEKETILVGPAKDTGEVDSAYNSLKDKKFNNIYVLSGGMEGWKNAGGNTISIGNPNSFVDQSKVPFITPENMKKAIEENNNFKFILDVRTRESFSSGHIKGAINITLTDLEKSGSQLPVGKEILVYGDSEIQSFQAGVRIHDLGYLAVSALKGGFSSWKEKGFPIEK